MSDRTDYDAIQAMNWSRLKLLEKSPAHFKQGYGGESDSMRLGTAAHAAVLEPEQFASDFVVYTEGIRRGKKWEEFEQKAIDAGKQVLNQKEYDEACAIRDSIRRHPRANALLSGGAAEQPLVWTVGTGDLKFACKGRADYIGAAIVDVKTCRDGSPKRFAAKCFELGYYGQAAWYSDGLFLATGERKPFYFVAVESTPPYLVSVYRVPDHVLEHGRNQYAALLGKLAYCEQNNFWGGYSEAEETDLCMPEWIGNVGGDE